MSATPVVYAEQVAAWRERLASERRQEAQADRYRRQLRANGRSFGSTHAARASTSHGLGPAHAARASTSHGLGSTHAARASTSHGVGSSNFARRSFHIEGLSICSAFPGGATSYTSTASAAMKDVTPSWQSSRPATRAVSQRHLRWSNDHSAIAEGGRRSLPWAPPEGHGVPTWTRHHAHLLYPEPPGTEARSLHCLARAEWGSLSGARLGL